MRMILTAGLTAMAASAWAGSIDVATPIRAERSIDYVSCPTCAPLKPRKKEQVEDIVLAPGTQEVEIRKVDGVLKVFRTEAWLGGSPVTYVTKAGADLIKADLIKTEKDRATANAKDGQPAIDTNTTSAVSNDVADPKPASTVPAALAKQQPAVVVPADVPQTADMSAGASAEVKAKVTSSPFDPASVPLRLSVQ